MADELDPLRTLNADAGHLDPERAARMRARALAGVLAEPAPARDAATRPRPRPPARPVDLVAEGDAIPVTIELDGDGRDRRPPAGRARRPFVVVAAAAAVLVALVGLAVARSGDPTPTLADVPAPADVAGIADAAGRLTDRPLEPGTAAHLAVEQATPTTGADGRQVTHVQDREVWAEADGSGIERTSPVTVLDPDGEAVGTLDQERTIEHPAGTLGLRGFGYDELRSFPTEPAALRAALEARTANPDADDYDLAVAVTDLLLLDATPPAVRAAAIDLLGDLGATLLPTATDPAGHDGFGIVVPTSAGLTRVLVVTRDGVLLGAYDVVTGSPLDPAAAVGWTTLERQDRDPAPT